MSINKSSACYNTIEKIILMLKIKWNITIYNKVKYSKILTIAQHDSKINIRLNCIKKKILLNLY